MIEKNDPFYQVPKRQFTLSSGVVVDVPVNYYEGRHLSLWFSCDPEKTQALLDEQHAPLVIVPNETGRALAYVGFNELLDTSVGAVNEGVLGIVCAHPDRLDEPAILVTDLPVTDEHVCLAGVEIYHYPKFMAEIPINFNGNQVTCQINDTEGKMIMQLSGYRGDTLPVPPLDMLTYAHLYRDASTPDMKQPTMFINNMYQVSSGHGLFLRSGDSEHRMAKNLRALGMDITSPLIAMYTDNFQARLDVPED
jgi:Acetoacetate decarboxylase (ADC)